ncbi:MAG: molecular chaperone DnaK [Planctomycetota bacterium]
MSKILGIDLGTTNSAVAVYHDGEARVIGPTANRKLVPSMVTFLDKKSTLVGEAARDQQVLQPENTVYSIKRFMGRRCHEVEREERLVPYPIVGKDNDYCKVSVGKKAYTPQQISAVILRELRRLAEEELEETCDRAVITVPAHFTDAQRQATRDAAKIAGLEVMRIINEPTAAALAHGVEQRGDRHIVVFDFGGGTFDLAVMRIKGGTFEVLASTGNTHLGGDDFDQRIIDVVADDFVRREAIDLRQNPMTLQRLKQAAAKAKAELSDRPVAEIMLPYVHMDTNNQPKHLQYSMTRERFESVCEDLFGEVRDACRAVVREAMIPPGSIDDVVLVGGSTRIPKVQKLAMEVFQTDQLDRSANPDEVVALGAATLGGVLQGDLQNVHLMDVTAHGFGVAAAGGRMDTVVNKNTPIPTVVKKIFSTPSDNQRSVPIQILEGEKTRVEDNRPLGTFQLNGIRKALRGVPRIEVSFSIDANGILDVTATDLDSGKTQNIVVTGSYGMEEDEIEQMRHEAEGFDEAAEQQQVVVELRNHAQQVHHNLTQWLTHNAGVMPPRQGRKLEAALQHLGKAVASDNTRGMKKALKQIDELWQGQYRQAG